MQSSSESSGLLSGRATVPAPLPDIPESSGKLSSAGALSPASSAVSDESDSLEPQVASPLSFKLQRGLKGAYRVLSGIGLQHRSIAYPGAPCGGGGGGIKTK